jgi:hypothetical protein
MLNVLLTLCGAHVSALVTVSSDSLCERIRKLKTCPIFKEDGSLVSI